MIEIITGIYLVYIFIALYFLSLFILTFIQNRKKMFDVPELKKKFSVSVIIPAYNEEESIRETLKAVLNSDYDNVLEIIVVNDESTDGTKKIIQEFAKKYSKVRLVDKKNSGKADSVNQAIKLAKGELVAVVDADSFPSEDAISKMVGFFEDEKMGAVTTRVLVRDPQSFMQKLQTVEYQVIAFTRRLLGFLDAIYVTPGPLALYRKSAMEKIGGFDVKNITEDIEVTWHLAFEGYKVKMSFVPSATTVSPRGFWEWLHQRQRWNIGGIQTIMKYKKYFFRKGMLGYFILPFFSISLLLGIFGLGLLCYRVSRKFLISYLSTKYSIGAQTAILTVQDINLHPSILHFFGITLFVAGLLFIFFALYMVNHRVHHHKNILWIFFYSLIYMMLYPLVLITSVYKYIRGNYSW